MLTQWPWPIFCAPLTLTQFTLTFQIFSTLKAYNYQTLHSASPRCTDLAGTLTRWPWPIFCAPVTLTYFASTFDISSTIRPTTIKPRKVLLLNVLTWQIPWPGDLDLYFGCSDFDIIYVKFQISSSVTPLATKPCIVFLLDVLTWQVSWPGDLDLYFALHWLLHLLRHPSICPQL